MTTAAKPLYKPTKKLNEKRKNMDNSNSENKDVKIQS